MGSIQQKLIILVLTLAFAIMASTPALGALSYEILEPDRRFLRNPLTVFPEANKCWNYINRVEGCQHEIFTAFGKGRDKMHVTPKCCKAIRMLPKSCAIWILGGRSFIPSSAYNVYDYCGSRRVTAPSINHDHYVHHIHRYPPKIVYAPWRNYKTPKIIYGKWSYKTPWTVTTRNGINWSLKLNIYHKCWDF